MNYDEFSNNCMEIEDPLTNTTLCGKILIDKEEWDVSFVCNFCNVNLPTLPELLRHALTEHLEGVPQHQLKRLCDIKPEKVEPPKCDDIQDELDVQLKGETEEYDVLECDSGIGRHMDSVDSLENEQNSKPAIECLKFDSQTKNYYCKICRTKFKFIYQFKSHMKSHGVKPFVCKECGASFSQNSRLKEHNLRHLGIKPYACAICQKTFTLERDMQRHKRTHASKRAFVECHLCDMSFISAAQLSSHQRLEHACPFCNQNFSLKSKLIEHIESHAVERPHKCTEYNASFKLRKGLNQHALLHSKGKMFCCELCEKPFVEHADIVEHMKLAHKKDR